MKTILFFSLCLLASAAIAQPQVVKQATISTTTNVIAPEGEDVQNLQNQGGGGFNFRNFGDGETKSTTIIKDSMVKTVMKNDMGRSTIIRNNSAKMTTTLLEIMGNRTGFYVTDEEGAQMKVRMDSMMQARRNADSTRPKTTATTNSATPVEIVYVDGTKKIAGYECKKALMINTRILGLKDTVAVWYNPEIRFENVASTGGTSSMGGFGNFGNFVSQQGFENINGFVMQYEMNMRRGRKMVVEVTRIDLKKEVADKEFEIPKDFDVKPIKEFQSMMQGGMQMMRMGGNNQ